MADPLLRLVELWPYLPAFRAVAETEHLPSAAERLHVRQATKGVSREQRPSAASSRGAHAHHSISLPPTSKLSILPTSADSRT